MDSSDEQHDDDLFADLYGDDEPKSAPEPPKAAPAVVTAVAPTKQAAPSVAVPNTAVPNVAVPNVAAPEQSLPASTMTNNSAPAAAPPKAVDPRAPQPPTEIQTDETFEVDQQCDQSHAYSGWDASNMAPQQQQEQQQNQQGHGGGESQGQGGYDHQPGSNSYGDHGNTGSPAIKEDGKMFIGGLNWETTDDSLKEYFSQFGEVTECTVMRDGPTGRSRGFGFLTFKDPKTVNIVMVKEHYLDGKIIDPKRAIPRDEQEKTSKIFVGGVSQEATESDFREYFLQFGRVLDATLMMDKDTGRPRGFGFVTFDSESAVENALSCPTLAILGKQIEVKKAQPRGNTRGGGQVDERDDRGGGGFRDRGNRDRFDNRDSVSNGSYMNGSQGGNGPQGGPQQQQAAAYNGMTPQMMAQYWQQMQRYMAAMSQIGRGSPMPVINPAMMQQAMQNMPQQMAGINPAMMQQMQLQQAAMMRQQHQHQQSPPIQSPPQQMPLQMAQQQQPYGNQNQGYSQHQHQQGGQGAGGYDPSQQQQANYNPNARFQNHPSQRDYQPPQNHPSSWDGMYDDVPPQQVVQQVHQQQAAQAAAAAQQSSRGGTPNGQQFGRFEGPPPNAPTGPRNTKPGSNYRGGRGGGGSGSAGGNGGGIGGRGAGYGSGARGGFHPYARNQERFT